MTTQAALGTIALQTAALALGALELVLAASLAYHYLLAVCGISVPRPALAPSAPGRCLAVLIPAHNEEAVIGPTVAAARAQQYPANLVRVCVVADHCTDATAMRASEAGATCLERADGRRGRKAYALQWGFEQLLPARPAFDAFVVIDADSLLEPTFLGAMAAHLGQGFPALQGQHRIANPADSGFTGLADVDMRINNLVRNQAKRNLGLSGRLMGDAMCFAREVIERFGWPTESITEDREFGLHLALQGIRTTYVPEAISHGQATARWEDATVQRLRWYRGMRQVRLSRLGPLWRAAVKLDLVALDQLLELALPSISISMLLGMLALGTQLALPSWPWLFPTTWVVAVVALWLLFPVGALVAARAPWASFRALLWGPVYLAWRAWVGLRASLGRVQAEWVRTRRREEMQGKPDGS